MRKRLVTRSVRIVEVLIAISSQARPGFLLFLAALQLNIPPAYGADSDRSQKIQWIHETLKNVYLAKRNLPAANDEFKNLAKLEPDDARLHFDYGNFLEICQKPDQALNEFRQAVELAPERMEYQGALSAAELTVRHSVLLRPSSFYNEFQLLPSSGSCRGGNMVGDFDYTLPKYQQNLFEILKGGESREKIDQIEWNKSKK